MFVFKHFKDHVFSLYILCFPKLCFPARKQTFIVVYKHERYKVVLVWLFETKIKQQQKHKPK